MSRSRSASVDANKTEERENLATVMGAAFQSNNKNDEEASRSDDQDGPDASQPDIQQPEGYTLSAVYPPQPCERCIRANKTCKGISGARCEHCKKLKQKCSNYNNAPPRGRHAVAAKSAANASLQKSPGPSAKYRRLGRRTAKWGLKTKQTNWMMIKQLSQLKKRRLSKLSGLGGDRKLHLERNLKELGAQISRVAAAQTAVDRELKKLQERYSVIAAAIQESDDD